MMELPKEKIDLVSIKYCKLIKDYPNELRIQSHGTGLLQLLPPDWP
jgi:hypothetical protein